MPYGGPGGGGRFVMNEVSLYRLGSASEHGARPAAMLPPRCLSPHGGLQTFPLQPTCLGIINFRALCGHVTPQNSEGTKPS